MRNDLVVSDLLVVFGLFKNGRWMKKPHPRKNKHIDYLFCLEWTLKTSFFVYFSENRCVPKNNYNNKWIDPLASYLIP